MRETPFTAKKNRRGGVFERFEGEGTVMTARHGCFFFDCYVRTHVHIAARGVGGVTLWIGFDKLLTNATQKKKRFKLDSDNLSKAQVSAATETNPHLGQMMCMIYSYLMI